MSGPTVFRTWDAAAGAWKVSTVWGGRALVFEITRADVETPEALDAMKVRYRVALEAAGFPMPLEKP